MLNPRLAHLVDYPFDRLRALLRDVSPPRGLVQHWLSVGEPRHAPPDMLQETLFRHSDGWGRYPPVEGTPEFRQAVADWLNRRYRLPAGLVDPDRHVLPVAGTREALFLIATVVLDAASSANPPVVVMPNPFYQVYYGAAVLAGAEPCYLPATAATGFLPRPDDLPPAALDRVRLIYLCSPANPQGASLSRADLLGWIGLARARDALLVVDECYAEIYDRVQPPGALEACADLGCGLANVLVFHSLSKRSSVPGLRSGFVAGDARVIDSFRRVRAFGGAAQPLPVLAASAALWRDEAHVAANRALYRSKLDIAERLLSGRFGFYRPAGGFFLWLDVGDGEAAAVRLWSEAGVRVLPGRYLAKPDSRFGDPGRPFIRIALIESPAATEDALTRLVSIL
ncbi:MAG: aminotransferase class I/II-fold pyridoxal phosphate-dependent enzyme [Rhodospirillales bacterium]